MFKRALRLEEREAIIAIAHSVLKENPTIDPLEAIKHSAAYIAMSAARVGKHLRFDFDQGVQASMVQELSTRV